MAIQKRIESLFEEIIANSKDEIINIDSCIDEALYLNSKRKVLFVLKESYTSSENKERYKPFGNEQYSITRILNKSLLEDKEDFGGYRKGTKKMFNRLGEWAYGLIYGIKDYNKVSSDLENEELKQKYLAECAYININKKTLVTEESKSSSLSKIKKEFKKNRELLKKQIKILSPDIIVCCGINGRVGIADLVAELFIEKPKWEYDGGVNGLTKINVNDKQVIVVSSYHPSAIKEKEKMYSKIATVFNFM